LISRRKFFCARQRTVAPSRQKSGLLILDKNFDDFDLFGFADYWRQSVDF